MLACNAAIGAPSRANQPSRAVVKPSVRAPAPIGGRRGVRVQAFDPASAELISYLFGAAVVATATVSLGQTIRHFNPEDPEVERINELAAKSRQAVFASARASATAAEPAAALAQAAVAEPAAEPAIKLAPVAAVEPVAAVAAAAEPSPAPAVPQPEARSWINNWLASKPAKVEEVHAPAAPEPVAALEAVAEPFKQEEPAPEAFTLAGGGVATTRVTEPSLPQPAEADPAMAAAVLDIMAADTAGVGITDPAAGGTGGSPAEPPAEEAPELVAVAASPIEQAKEAARAYEAKVSSILADARPAYRAARRAQAATAAAPAAVANTVRRRVASIKEGYQARVEALWTAYEEKREAEAALRARSEKLLLDLAALDEAQAREAEERRARGILAEFVRRVLAFFAAVAAWVQAVVARLTGRGGPGAASSFA